MAASAITVKRLVVPKAPDVLAEHLRETILRGELAEGSPLPTERELGERSGLSRASVREALRILESEGLIQTRPGRNGGASVKQPTAQSRLSFSRLGLGVHSITLRSSPLVSLLMKCGNSAVR